MKPVCLVTGAAGKLGADLCRAFIDTHEVAAVYRNRVPDVPSQLCTPVTRQPCELPSLPRLAFCVQADLADRQDVRRVVEVVLARFGRIDLVINAAADIRFHGKLVDLCFDDSAVTNQLAINAVAPMALVSRIFQESWKNEPAANREANRCVINISSMSGLYVYGTAGQAFYSASKAALNFLTLHLAHELAPYSIRVNAVCPSRFPDSIPVETVTGRVKELMKGQTTGEIVEIVK